MINVTLRSRVTRNTKVATYTPQELLDKNEYLIVKEMSKCNCPSTNESNVVECACQDEWEEYDLIFGNEAMNALEKLLPALTEKELKALKEAVSVIWFNDSSDYINGLWEVIKSIIGDEIVEDESFEISNLKKLLDRHDS